MTQFPHDQFAKDLLETLLSPFGEVQIAKTIDAQVREIDRSNQQSISSIVGVASPWRIESLGDALLDFNTTDDLTAWLDKSLSGIQ